MTSSELDYLINPEIKHDEFYEFIQELVSQSSIKTILEIGSSSGEGSTEAFVLGVRQNPNKPLLFCMEVSETRFHELEARYTNDSFVQCYNCSSVPLEDFPTPQEVIRFYDQVTTNLNAYPLEEVLRWLSQDIEYVRQLNHLQDGINHIKQDNNIDYFDVVLIDGSEFTGEKELEKIYGAKYILLDDINGFKNYNNYQRLINDSQYCLCKENWRLRNGYAVFRKLELDDSLSEFYFNVEKNEQQLVRNLVKHGMIVFDVGANLGDYSVLLSNLVGKDGRVITFEPTSSIFSRLEERLRKFDNISVYKKAVFSSNGQIEFNTFPDEYSVWNSVGRPEMFYPGSATEYVPIANTEIVESISLDSFCQSHDIQTIDYLKVDVEGAEKQVLQGAHDLLTRKAVRFLQFEISQKMLEGLGQTATEVFNLLYQYGYECHRISIGGEVGEQVFDSNSFYENYIAFPVLPVHFFTIVLNGEPFIRYHINVFKDLPFNWHWHIVEGVADLKHDTAWSLRTGGHIDDQFHIEGKSIDGTTQYLDDLVSQYPDNITLYRKPQGIFWDGKLEMVNAPLENINEDCLLWQIDADELWTIDQISKARNLFIQNPEKTAAFYWCWYFVGEKLVISSRYCYTQNPNYEWLRTWRYKSGQIWSAHEPPILAEAYENGYLNIASINPFSHHETEEAGLIFQHLSYVTEAQVEFKEHYYGYANAVRLWQHLQENRQFPVPLRDFFPWVQDPTIVSTTGLLGIVPLANYRSDTGSWEFLSSEELKRQKSKLSHTTLVVIDGVFFQFAATGIARVWLSLFREWVKSEFSQHVLVLDRAGTAPKVSGIRYRTIPYYNYKNSEVDRQLLQMICDEEGAEIFLSTYYTTPISTSSVLVIHDMIPELILKADLNQPEWREKHNSIRYASTYITVSENTARDLLQVCPEISPRQIQVAHCGVEPSFQPAGAEQIALFKTKYGIHRPYFLVVGAGAGQSDSHKNISLFLQAFATLSTHVAFDIVCTGGGLFESSLRAYITGSTVHLLWLDDHELSVAYSGAIALVYPSKYEGFGMPVAEAMACGCPVITCPNGSLPEVAGDAAIYVPDDDVSAMADALCEVQKPDLRELMIAAGLTQAQSFSWTKMAKIVQDILLETTLKPLYLRDINWLISPNWHGSEDVLFEELVYLLRAITLHPQAKDMTLLIYVGDFSEEDANLFMSGVMMHLCLEDNVDLEAGSQISLFSSLQPPQWQALHKYVHGLIRFESDASAHITDLLGNKVETVNFKDFLQAIQY